MLRSNVTDWTPEELWRAYLQLAEAEAAFRIHKSDLQIRPDRRMVQMRPTARVYQPGNARRASLSIRSSR
jgi:hypothetical protein